jgi:hypothetical protein
MFAVPKRRNITSVINFKKRELSSAGSEHLPYKQRVTGSNPVAPTQKGLNFRGLFSFNNLFQLAISLWHLHTTIYKLLNLLLPCSNFF